MEFTRRGGQYGVGRNASTSCHAVLSRYNSVSAEASANGATGMSDIEGKATRSEGVSNS